MEGTTWGPEWEKLVGDITKTVEEAALVAQDAVIAVMWVDNNMALGNVFP